MNTDEILAVTCLSTFGSSKDVNFPEIFAMCWNHIFLKCQRTGWSSSFQNCTRSRNPMNLDIGPPVMTTVKTVVKSTSIFSYFVGAILTRWRAVVSGLLQSYSEKSWTLLKSTELTFDSLPMMVFESLAKITNFIWTFHCNVFVGALISIFRIKSSQPAPFLGSKSNTLQAPHECMEKLLQLLEQLCPQGFPVTTKCGTRMRCRFINVLYFGYIFKNDNAF